MEWGRVAETERIPKRGGDYTERVAALFEEG